MIKRAFDLVVGAALSVLTAPLVATLALLIAVESRGHPIYTQTRVGQGGRPFQIFKLRTMVAGAEFQGAGLAINVKPGITGWAQVNGRNALPWPERIELDLWYVEHRSLALDVRILRQTFGQVLGGAGMYKGSTGGWNPPERQDEA
jgi:lipopolysaccharide/colanic/teichoic acid biosynthesis glycosyltransferase